MKALSHDKLTGGGRKAYLILEDGTVFAGTGIGAEKTVISEIVFNTSMAGYLEVLTDPSYAGQAVAMTYPLIGNYGICFEDMESAKPWSDGFIVRELSRLPSNFRSEDTIQHFLTEHGIPGICGIDTRALTRILREKGTMNGMITGDEAMAAKPEEVLAKIRAYRPQGVVKRVTRKEKTVLFVNSDCNCNSNSGDNNNGKNSSNSDGSNGKGEHSSTGYCVALLDFGAKDNIARSLVQRGCQVTIYPADTKAEEIIRDAPDGIMLSNGPGDPKECVEIIGELKKLYGTDIPIFAICLGHQLMALAAGGDTYKMKYGHRGANHPVKDLETGRVYISSQNHGYVVDAEKMDSRVAVPAFVNVNDGTNEGLSYVGKNIFTVQFHPEACPGPRDSACLFDRFMKMMEVER